MVFYREGNKLKTLNYCSIDKLFPNLVNQVIEYYKLNPNEQVLDGQLTRDIIKNGLDLQSIINPKHYKNKVYNTKILSMSDISNIKSILVEELKFIFSLTNDNVEFKNVSGYQKRFTMEIIRNNNDELINGIIVNNNDFEYQFAINGVFSETLYFMINFDTDKLRINWQCSSNNIASYITYEFKDKNAFVERIIYLDEKVSFYDKKALNYQDYPNIKSFININDNDIGTNGIMIYPDVYVLVKRFCNNNSDTIKTAFLLIDNEEILIKESGYNNYSSSDGIVRLNEYMINTKVLLEDNYGLVQYSYYPCILSDANYKNIMGNSAYNVFFTDKKTLLDIEKFDLQSLNEFDMRYDDIYNYEMYVKKIGNKK